MTVRIRNTRTGQVGEYEAEVVNGDGTFSDVGEAIDAAVVAGAPAIASQAEAEAGENNTKMMTPLRTAQAIAALGGGDVEINAQTDDYELVIGDKDKLVIVAKGSAVNLTVPPDVFTTGNVIGLAQGGAGTLTVVEGSGVTVNSEGGAMAFTGQWAVASLICTGSNEFLLYGRIA